MNNAQSHDIVEVNQPSDGQITFGLHWIGYLSLVPVTLLYAAIIYFTATRLADMKFGLMIYGIYAFALVSVVYQGMLIRSVKLVINDDGVWTTKGILPWKKSCVGLQWRNVAIASYTNGFVTWLFGAYTINLEDRFTGNIEMTVNNIGSGKFAVSEINRILAERHAA